MCWRRVSDTVCLWDALMNEVALHSTLTLKLLFLRLTQPTVT